MMPNLMTKYKVVLCNLNCPNMLMMSNLMAKYKVVLCNLNCPKCDAVKDKP
jgi:hypothetical protein